MNPLVKVRRKEIWDEREIGNLGNRIEEEKRREENCKDEYLQSGDHSMDISISGTGKAKYGIKYLEEAR